MPCVYCKNWKNSKDRKQYHDNASIPIGEINDYYELKIEVGGLVSVPRIVVEKYYSEPKGEMRPIGVYYPKYCPECGEKIEEDK